MIAAGQLAPAKRYDVLIRAFEKVVAERPDWRLRIYGAGAERAKLRALIDKRGLYNHVYLMGPATPLEPEWVKGSIGAVTSSLESFGMTIVEAMRCGLPVVSTDCPHGPGEIIDNGVDGLLVPVGKVDEIAAGLLKLINDDELRKSMGERALENSARFDPDRVAGRYEELFTDLLARGALRGSLHRTRGALLSSAFRTKDRSRSAPAKGASRMTPSTTPRGEHHRVCPSPGLRRGEPHRRLHRGLRGRTDLRPRRTGARGASPPTGPRPSSCAAAAPPGRTRSGCR
ncbi:hypothetical protein GCM10020000_63460 [Streptomyces olivoverticillatus]